MNNKTCIRCGLNKSSDQFRRHSYCIECMSEYSREYRAKNLGVLLAKGRINDHLAKDRRRKWVLANRDKRREIDSKYKRGNSEKGVAHGVLGRAIENGKVQKPNKCSACKEIKRLGEIQGHHEDYSQPLDVVWLCYTCHRRLHRKEVG